MLRLNTKYIALFDDGQVSLWSCSRCFRIPYNYILQFTHPETRTRINVQGLSLSGTKLRQLYLKRGQRLSVIVHMFNGQECNGTLKNSQSIVGPPPPPDASRGCWDTCTLRQCWRSALSITQNIYSGGGDILWLGPENIINTLIHCLGRFGGRTSVVRDIYG
jgi:hypothetical protein